MPDDREVSGLPAPAQLVALLEIHRGLVLDRVLVLAAVVRLRGVVGCVENGSPERAVSRWASLPWLSVLLDVHDRRVTRGGNVPPNAR
jgi:hypothetical protein